MRSRLLQVQAFVAILCLLCSVRPVFSQFFAEDWKIVRIGNDAAPSYLFPRHAIPLIAEKSNEHAQGFSSAINTFAETLCRNVLGSPKELTLTPIPPVTIGNTTDHTFNVSYRGVRIRGARMTITVGNLNNTIVAIRTSIPASKPLGVTATQTIDDILHKTDLSLGDGFKIISAPHLVYIPSRRNSQMLLCYEVTARDAEREPWRLTLDAATGTVIEKRSLLEYEHNAGTSGLKKDTVKGYVHLNSPYDTLTLVPFEFDTIYNSNDTTAADSLGVASLSGGGTLHSILANRYMQVTNLNGQSAAPTASANASSIIYSNDNSDPAERDAYRTINKARRIIRQLDTSLIRLDTMLNIYVNDSSTCNAYYDPTTVSIHYFQADPTGACTNAAEVFDVAAHEFGHRIQHAVFETVGNDDSDIVNSSLGEGFADLYSSFMRDDPRIGIDFITQGGYIRNAANDDTWPDSTSSDPHQNGMIASGAYWDIRQGLGLDSTFRLFHRMMYHRPDAPDDFSPAGLLKAYLSTLIETLVADDNDNDLSNGTPHSNLILSSFARHNVTLTGLIDLTVEQLPDQDTGSVPYPVRINANYNGPLGELDSSSISLSYTTGNSKQYNKVQATRSPAGFIALIPAQPAGTVVSYFATAKLSITPDSLAAPQQPDQFLVGFKPIFSDNCEADNGWKLGSPSDDASNGIWERAIPVGTFLDSGASVDFVQQDTDHTANGKYCYVTGNQNAGQVDQRNPFLDPVSGTTTLYSPIIHFSSQIEPVFRFWYYYKNQDGFFQSLPVWTVKLSVNGGQTWKTVIQSTDQTPGWTQQIIQIPAVPEGTAEFEFVASADFVYSCVEAGIDDAQALEVPASSVTPALAASRPSDPFPMPIEAGKTLHITGDMTAMSLFDLNGKLIVTSNMQSSLDIPTETISGVYLLKVTERSGTIDTYKVIVTR